MENKKKSIALVAKVIGGIAFLALFVLNIMVFVHNDKQTGKLSVTSLKAYADDEESGGGGTPPADPCTQCVVKQLGIRVYSCKPTLNESCTSPSKYGTTVSCQNAKECE